MKRRAHHAPVRWFAFHLRHGLRLMMDITVALACSAALALGGAACAAVLVTVRALRKKRAQRDLRQWETELGIDTERIARAYQEHS